MPTATQNLPASHDLRSRLLKLYERTNDPALRRLASGEPPFPGGSMATAREQGDWVSTCLMNTFKNTGDAEVFALLFELNRSSFLQAIKAFLRRGCPCIEASDVLQEVFLNIYSYPRRFLADRADAFRCWGHRIVRNTMLKQLRKLSRHPIEQTLDDASPEPEDQRTHSPERVASEQESADLVNHAYLLFLGLYLAHFCRLSPKMQRVLTLAEVEHWNYRAIAAEFGMPMPHVKMLVYRSRQRIYRGMTADLEGTASPVAGKHRAVATRCRNDDSCWRQSVGAF